MGARTTDDAKETPNGGWEDGKRGGIVSAFISMLEVRVTGNIF